MRGGPIYCDCCGVEPAEGGKKLLQLKHHRKAYCSCHAWTGRRAGARRRAALERTCKDDVIVAEGQPELNGQLFVVVSPKPGGGGMLAGVERE